MVIGSTREEDLSCIQFVECATYRPDVDGRVIRRSEDNFWSPVKPADEVRRDLVLRGIRCGTKITQFEHGLLFVHQDIVRLDIGVHDVALLQEIQSEEELFGIYPDGPNVQSNIFAKALDDVTKIHAQRFEDDTEVPAVFKSSL